MPNNTLLLNLLSLERPDEYVAKPKPKSGQGMTEGKHMDAYLVVNSASKRVLLVAVNGVLARLEEHLLLPLAEYLPTG